MCDFQESSQLHDWLFPSYDSLERCRAKANQLARQHLANRSKESKTNDVTPVESFGCGFCRTKEQQSADADKMETDDDNVDPTTVGPWKNAKDHPFVTPEEEALLVAFYVSKLPSLIGPLAQVPRLRRESKVTATAAMLLRRFYLSNSVMIHDPKAVMVAAAFLATKVEDATADIRYLEDGTNLMNAPVAMAEILPAELNLLSGIQFHLLCFHPYKAVVALTEDLRTFLKSEKGKYLIQNKRIAGEDLKPMYDAARAVLDDVVVSDIPFLYTPGQVGMAALMVANEDVQKQQQQLPQPSGDHNGNNEEQNRVPPIDMIAYIRLRFSEEKARLMEVQMKGLCPMLRALRNGKYGCGNHHVDMAQLKAVHKKLKKCRAWGNKEKKSKKRGSTDGKDNDDEPKSKKPKTE